MQKSSIVIYPQKNQFVQDAYDALISNLFMNYKEDVPKVLCVTSVSPGAGKTTISINTSLSLVLAGWKVCLIDADIRKIDKIKRLSAANLVGLSDYLDGLVKYEEIVSETNIDKLKLITSGDITNKNPLGMLYSSKFSELLEHVRSDFDFVVFDTSSLDTNSDSSVIASKADGTLLVTPMGANRSELQRHQNRLESMDVRIAGNVLNKVPRNEYRKYRTYYNHFSNLKKKSSRGYFNKRLGKLSEKNELPVMAEKPEKK